MAIDFHTHLFTPEIVASRATGMADPAFAALYANKRAKIVGHDGLLAGMDDAGINSAVVMGFPWTDEDLRRRQNDHFAELARIELGVLFFFGSVPMDPATTSEEIDGAVRLLREQGMYGIGEIAYYGSGLTEAAASHLRSVLAAADTHGMPVCLHVNEPLGHRYAGKISNDFGRLYDVIADHPAVTIVLSHWGGGVLFYELMPEVRKAFARVYYDTAASPLIYDNRIYASAVSLVGSGKIILGSDYPLTGFARYIAPIKKLTDARDRDTILRDNARRVLGLIE